MHHTSSNENDINRYYINLTVIPYCFIPIFYFFNLITRKSESVWNPTGTLIAHNIYYIH